MFAFAFAVGFSLLYYGSNLFADTSKLVIRSAVPTLFPWIETLGYMCLLLFALTLAASRNNSAFPSRAFSSSLRRFSTCSCSVRPLHCLHRRTLRAPPSLQCDLPRLPVLDSLARSALLRRGRVRHGRHDGSAVLHVAVLRADSRIEVGVERRVKGRIAMVVRAKGRYHPSITIEEDMNASAEFVGMMEESESAVMREIRRWNANYLLPFFSNYGQFRTINIRYRESNQSV